MKSQYDVYMCRKAKESVDYRKLARRELILRGCIEPETDEEKMFLKVVKAINSEPVVPSSKSSPTLKLLRLSADLVLLLMVVFFVAIIASDVAPFVGC